MMGPMATPTLPLLLLDVDGLLNPYAAKPHRRPQGYGTHRIRPDSWVARQPQRAAEYVRPLRVWLNPEHGPPKGAPVPKATSDKRRRSAGARSVGAGPERPEAAKEMAPS